MQPTRLLTLALVLGAVHPHVLAQIPANTFTYYVSNNGNDAQAGTSPATAWKTLAKVTAFGQATGFHAGDSILLERGGTWNEMLTLGSNGTSAARINLSHYGLAAAPPVITRINAGLTARCVYLTGSHWSVRGLQFERAHRGIECDSLTG